MWSQLKSSFIFKFLFVVRWVAIALIGACLVHAIWIRIQWFKSKITGSHSKKSCLVQDIWVRIEIPTWILCGSHTKFEFSLWAVFESKPDSNPDWIHVWVPVYYRYWAHLISFLSIFSLSPPDASLSLSLNHYKGQSPSIHSNSKKTSCKTHSKKTSQIKTYQAQPTITR